MEPPPPFGLKCTLVAERNAEHTHQAVLENIEKSDESLALEPLTPNLQRSEVYRQANALARAAQDLTVYEKRIIVLGLSLLDPFSENPSLEVVLPLSLFEEFGLENPYVRAREASLKLRKSGVDIQDDFGGFISFPWTQKVEYVHHDRPDNALGYTYLHIIFNEELRPYLANLHSRFAVLPVGEVVQFNTIFATRLYEIIWHSSMAGRLQHFEIPLMDLKFSLGLVKRNGKRWTDEKYADWRDFRKQLKTHLDAINEAASLNATMTPMRVGRRIGRIRFDVETVRPIPHLGKGAVPPTRATADTLERLTRELAVIGFTGVPANLINSYGVEAVEAGIKLVQRMIRAGSLSNPGGMLVTVLKDGRAHAELKRIQEQSRLLEAETTDSDGSEQNIEPLWDIYRRKVAQDLITANGLTSDDVIRITRESLAENSFLIKQLEAADWAGSLFDLYSTAAVLNDFAEEAPHEALDLAAFGQARPTL